MTVVVERRIKARPETVFAYFTDRDRWLLWQGVDALIEPEQGGAFRVNVTGNGFASGRFVEVDPPHRIVFTWGWEEPDNLTQPGTSTVEIELWPEQDGTATLLRLTHRDLLPTEDTGHEEGWMHYLDRLRVVAEGGDPGRDPWRP